jgi:HAD superfamily hydrolase (TIGR01509 family)
MVCPKVVFLDLDGTLVEFRIRYLEARQEALSLLKNYEVTGDLKFTVRDSIFLMDREIKRVLGERLRPEQDYRQIHERLIGIVQKYEMQAAESTRLLPLVSETLEKLKEMGLRLVLFTADGDKAMNLIVNRTGIRKFFEVMISRGEFNKVKPHPDHITSAMLLVCSKSEETIVVGDSVADIASGKSVGAITVGVTTGLNSRQELSEVEADYLIDSVADLPDLIREIWRTRKCQ